MGVMDYEAQTAVLSEQYAQAIIENKSSLADEIKDQMDMLAEYGGAYVSLRENLRYQYEEFNKLKKRYEEAKVDAELSLPNKFIVNSAFAAEKKFFSNELAKAQFINECTQLTYSILTRIVLQIVQTEHAFLQWSFSPFVPQSASTNSVDLRTEEDKRQ